MIGSFDKTEGIDTKEISILSSTEGEPEIKETGIDY